jgi:hypothetical protein
MSEETTKAERAVLLSNIISFTMVENGLALPTWDELARVAIKRR